MEKETKWGSVSKNPKGATSGQSEKDRMRWISGDDYIFE